MTTSHHRCVLIRHGETEWSLDGRHTGRTDLPLLPEGEAQATALRPALAGYRFTTVLTSPRLRARETCRLAGLNEGALVDTDLAEWDYGSYEGVTTSAIQSGRPGWDLFADGAPGGEGADDVARRVDRVIKKIRGTGGDVAVFAHSHVLRVLVVRWIGLGPTAGRHFVLAPASLSELGWEREQPAVIIWNSGRL
jgi:probable phosphoglycerate mutase